MIEQRLLVFRQFEEVALLAHGLDRALVVRAELAGQQVLFQVEGLAGHAVEALVVCLVDVAALARLAMEAEVVRVAARIAGSGQEAVEKAVASTIDRRRLEYERWLFVLGTLGNNAPFIGLFGTVLGIIRAFADLAAHPAAAAGASTVMAGISEALVATAIGLFVAIPAVLAYNIYQRLLKRVVGRSQSLGNAIAAGLHVARSNGKGA